MFSQKLISSRENSIMSQGSHAAGTCVLRAAAASHRAVLWLQLTEPLMETDGAALQRDLAEYSEWEGGVLGRGKKSRQIVFLRMLGIE